MSSFTNQGEVCLCTERIYVHESVYDEFMQKFIAEARKFTVGDPRSPATRCGALCGKPHYDKGFILSHRQPVFYFSVISYFEYAKEKGFVIYACQNRSGNARVFYICSGLGLECRRYFIKEYWGEPGQNEIFLKQDMGIKRTFH